MKNLFIKNAILNNSNTDILIENGKISRISRDISNANNYPTIDATGLTVIPGLIDMQVHFREPGFEYKETIATGSRAAVSGGFTQVAIMPNTNPTIDTRLVIQDVKKRIQETSPIDIHIIPAMTFGIKGNKITDYDEYLQEGIIGITDDGRGVQNNAIMEVVYREGTKRKLSIMQHCEFEHISDHSVVHDGIYAANNNLKGYPAEAESKMIKRDIELLRKYGGHYHVLHVSCKKSMIEIENAKKEGLNITCEVTPHHLLLCDEDIKNTNFKMNPPLRSKEDMLYLQEAFLNQKIDIVTTDHAPHSKEEKAKSLLKAPFGIIGLETAFPLMYTYFVHANRCSLEHLIDKMSTKPKEIFNLKGGSITTGNIADLALVNTEKELKVSPYTLYSKSDNTPFMDYDLKGWIKVTIKNGEIIFNRNSI